MIRFGETGQSVEEEMIPIIVISAGLSHTREQVFSLDDFSLGLKFAKHPVHKQISVQICHRNAQ
jgi:hypothetical protein